MLSVTDPTPVAPCPTPFNLAAHVLGRAEALADKIALQVLTLSGAERWSYGRVLGAVRGVSHGLSARGLRPGDRVLLRLGNSVEFPLAFLGAVGADLLPVAAPAALTGAEVTRLAAEVAPALIIAAEGVSLPADCPAPVLMTADLRAMAEGPGADFLLGDPNRPAYLVYTSGTSGRPRAVLHAHRAVWARRMMWDGWYDLKDSDRLLHAGAFNWTYTLGTGLFDPWAIGATALVPGPGIGPAQLPLFLKRFDATLFAAAPGVYRQMLKSGQPLNLPKLRHGLVAGEKLPDSVRADWERQSGRPVYEAYGLSECSTFISSNPGHPHVAGATGFPQPGRRIAVLGPDGQPVPRETPGVLAVHRSDPGLFLGYWGDRADTAAKFRGDWFVTGDQVRMDPGGAIHYLGRDDDMMNAGGFRVSPLEVEGALAACQGAGDVAVIEVRLPGDKSVIAAFYTGPAPPDALKAHAETHLARYKQPRIFEQVADLPRTATGKISRRTLRDQRMNRDDPA